MLPTRNIKVLLRYRDPLMQAGIMTTLRQQFDFDIVPDLADKSFEADADVIVADYELGLETIVRNKRLAFARGGAVPKVLIVTSRESESEIRHALESGARGYLLTGCRLEDLVDGVRAVHRGMRHLSEVATQRLAESLTHQTLTGRETEVLRLMASGHPNKAIGTKLNIAVGTVKTHIKGILLKLHAASRTEATAVAERRGLLVEREAADTLADMSLDTWHPRPVLNGKSFERTAAL